MIRCLVLCLLISCLFACNVEDIVEIENLNNSYTCEESDDIKKNILILVNNARANARQCGSEYFYPASPVLWNNTLQKAAKKHSNDMASNNFFEHTGSNGSDPGNRIVEQGYNWITYG